MASKDKAEEIMQRLSSMKTGDDMEAIAQYLYNSMMAWTDKKCVNGIEWNREEVSKVIHGICQHFEMDDHKHKRSYLIQTHTIQGDTKPMSVDAIVLQLARKTYREDKNLDNAINRYLQLTKRNQNKNKEENGGENKDKTSLHHNHNNHINNINSSSSSNGNSKDNNNNATSTSTTTITKKKEKNKKRSRSEMEQEINTSSVSTTTKKKKKEKENGHSHDQDRNYSNGYLPASKKVKTNNHSDNKTHNKKLLEADIYAGESEDDSMDEDKNIPSCNRREIEKKEKKKKENKEMEKQKNNKNGNGRFNKGDAKLFEILKLIKNGAKVDNRGNLQGIRDEEEEEEKE